MIRFARYTSLSVLAAAAIAIPASGVITLSSNAYAQTEEVARMRGPSAAERCRDCPFPFRIDRNRWQMPHSRVMVEIRQSHMPGGAMMLHIALKNVDSGQVLAAGHVRREADQDSVSMTLRDERGRPVAGQIIYVNEDESVIQARFKCREANQCSVPPDIGGPSDDPL